MAVIDEQTREYAQASYAATCALVEACRPLRQAIVAKRAAFSELDGVLFASYLRGCWWMDSLIRLKEPHDTQAILHGVRCLYELWFDLVDLTTDPALLARYLAFDRVSRFAALERLVAALPGSDVITPGDDAERAVVNDAQARQEYDSLRTTYFAGKVPRHWHLLSLADRARAHGKDEEVRYRRLYSKLCTFSHAGLVNPDALAMVHAFAMGNEFAHSLFLGLTDLIGRRFAVLDLIEPAVKGVVIAKQEKLAALAIRWGA